MWNTPVCLVTILISICSLSLADGSSQRTINLMVNENGTQNESLCKNGSQPCATLNMALNILYNDSDLASVRVVVSPGNYSLKHGEENHINGKLAIDFIGSGVNDTIVVCEPSAGLLVSNSNLTVTAITFMNCGHDTQSLYNFDSTLLQPAALISSQGCTTLTNVTIMDSIGSGLLIYSTECNNETTISSTSIIRGNGIDYPYQLGGGIVIIGDGYYDDVNQPKFVISNCVLRDNYYFGGAPVIAITTDLLIESAALVLIEIGQSIVVDSCLIADNNRGISLYEVNYLSFNISNSEILSNWNDSIVAILNTGRVDLSLYDANVTDLITVDQKTIGIFNPYGPNENDCQVPLNSLKMSLVCSGQKTCSVPSIDFKYSCELENIYQYGDITPGVCSNDSYYHNYRGQCPVPYSISVRHGDKYLYSCWDNHGGPLCGQCLENHSVAINSPYLACVECSDWSTILKGWCLLILLEFLPLTIMVAVIIILNVNLNQGSLKAFIFFSQMLMIPFPSVSYPSWLVMSYSFDYRYINLYFVPFQIWVLGFINYPSCNTYTYQEYASKTTCTNMPICISSNTTALGAISFWYLIAFYPFVILLLVYLCMIAYNRGYKPFVCVIKPIHHLLACLWQRFDIKPSFSQNIASVYTLCFTQLAAISFKILHATTTYDNGTVFFYDGSQKYFSGWHGAACTLALIVLIVFIIIPTVYVALYPSAFFQKHLLVKFKVVSNVAKVIIMPYKEGAWGYRYFACSHYILQLYFMFLYFFSSETYTILVIQIIFCGLFIAFLTVFRPYEKMVHTVVNIIFLLILISFSISLLILNIDIDYFTVPIVLAIYVLPLLYLCLLLVTGYVCFVWIPIKVKAALFRQSSEIPVTEGIQSEASNSLLGKPIANPSYNTIPDTKNTL